LAVAVRLVRAARPDRAGRVEGAANHVVANAGQVLHTAPADQHHAVLLEVVALARDVADDLHLVGEPYPAHLAQSGVRLLRRGRVHTQANAAFLRARAQSRRGRTGAERLPSGANELLYRGHWTVYVGRRTDPGREGTGRVARAGPLSSPGRTSTTAFPHYHPRARPVSSARGPARPRARRVSSSRGPSFLRPLLSFHPRRFTARLPRGGGASGGARASRAAARPRTRPH